MKCIVRLLSRNLGLAVGASAIAALLATPLFAEGSSTQKLEPFLRASMSTGNGLCCVQAANGVSAKSLSAKANSSEIRLLVKVTDKGSQLQSFLAKNGGQITSRQGNIVCVRTPYAALSDMAKLDSVTRIEASKKLNLCNDIAASAEHGTKLENLVAQNARYQGQGVLVGVVDTGIDTTSEAFRDADGNSRILYFWNQTKDDSQRYPTVITPEGESRTYKYGSEYTAADIEAQTSESPVYIDEVGHGTHVCGTIGGRDAKYPGMAPQAQYMVVATNEGEGECVDAFQYLLSRAKELNMPLVVNISMGSPWGPHDGTCNDDLAVQNMVEQDNLIINCAAGNYGNANISAMVDLGASAMETVKNNFTVLAGEPLASINNALEIWSTGSQELEITVSNGSVSRTIAYNEEITDPETFGSGINLMCRREHKSVQNGDDHVMLLFNNTGAENVVIPLQIELNNKVAQPLTVHLYADNASSPFQDHVCSGTVITPASAPGAIAVGVYTTRTSWTSVGGTWQSSQTMDALAKFSSCGPVRRPDLYNALDVIKPDIIAPGSLLISQFSKGYSDYLQSSAPAQYEQLAVDDTHVVKQGTSMSTPVVTGTVALMLQNMPQASVAKIKEVLHSTARHDKFTSDVPNDECGYGKLDASCVESTLLESPQPTVDKAERDGSDKANLIITGSNFVPASDVYVNGIAWDSQKIVLVDSTSMILQEVYTADSPLLSAGAVKVDTVKVVNFLGKTGANSAEYQVGEEETKSASSGSGGCFIATAAYGSYLEPEVMTLRRFRDRDLITNAPGRAFVKMYYRYSPPVAAFIAEHPCARFATRLALTPVVYSVSHPDVALAAALALGLGGGLLYRRRRA